MKIRRNSAEQTTVAGGALSATAATVVLWLGLWCALPGCSGDGSSSTGAGGAGPGIEPVAGSGAGTSPNAADGSTEELDAATSGVRLVVHPLTRVGTDSEGKPALIVHLEVRDAFDQSVKALGVVHVDLLKSGGSGVEREWVVDVRDAKTNALMYDDLVTRTYTLPLGGVPQWVLTWSARSPEDGAGGSGGAAAPMVRARLVTVDDQGRTRELKASGRVGR